MRNENDDDDDDDDDDVNDILECIIYIYVFIYYEPNHVNITVQLIVNNKPKFIL